MAARRNIVGKTQHEPEPESPFRSPEAESEEKQRHIAKIESRRDFIRKSAAGTALVALGGGLYRIAADDLTKEAQARRRADGRPVLPPGQKVLSQLKPMGGRPGVGRIGEYRLKVHGLVSTKLHLDYRDLLKLERTEVVADVHCVTGWSVLGARWTGVRVSHLAKLAGVKDGARHVIFEGAHGYTANVRLSEATRDNVLVTWRLNGRPFAKKHGAPVRALVPDLYFWKSAKWLKGIKFVGRDRPGYWERRGYHNHADPWREERHG